MTSSPSSDLTNQSDVLTPKETAPPTQLAPQDAGAGKRRGLPKITNLWSGVQNLYQRISKPISAAMTKKDGEKGRTAAPDDFDDVGLVLDGPGVAAHKQQVEAEQLRQPRLGDEPPALHGQCRLDVGSATTTGRVRERNEDSFLVQQLSWFNLDQWHDSALIVVADGMGGYSAGERASFLAIQQISASLREAWACEFPGNRANKLSSFQAPIKAAIKSANNVVNRESRTGAEKKTMGATAALVVVRDGAMEIGHVGDCRVYLVRNGQITQLTKDQTLVNRMVELGQLTEAEAKDYSSNNEVTQAIGKNPDIEPAFYQYNLAPGDWLIVACDGLHAHVTQEAIESSLKAAKLSATLVAHYLVDLTNFHGGSDNCTVVAVRCY